MAMQSRSRTGSFRLNEPSAKILGGAKRRSVLVNRRQFPNILRRERLEQILLVHDLFDADLRSHEMTSEDFLILRQIAQEGAMTNLVPAIRANAILMLGKSPTVENLNLLTDLARNGEDFYVRSHALNALGRTGLRLVAPIVLDALASSERLERQTAENALVALARTNGIEFIGALAVGEGRKHVKEGLERVNTILASPPVSRRKRRKRRSTSRS